MRQCPADPGEHQALGSDPPVEEVPQPAEQHADSPSKESKAARLWQGREKIPLTPKESWDSWRRCHTAPESPRSGAGAAGDATELPLAPSAPPPAHHRHTGPGVPRDTRRGPPGQPGPSTPRCQRRGAPRSPKRTLGVPPTPRPPRSCPERFGTAWRCSRRAESPPQPTPPSCHLATRSQTGLRDRTQETDPTTGLIPRNGTGPHPERPQSSSGQAARAPGTGERQLRGALRSLPRKSNPWEKIKQQDTYHLA